MWFDVDQIHFNKKYITVDYDQTDKREQIFQANDNGFTSDIFIGQFQISFNSISAKKGS